MTSFTHQLNLFDSGWPLHDRFPHNNNNEHVKELVINDMLESEHPLIITGFTSLEMLVEFLATKVKENSYNQDIRIMIGNEPFPNRPQKLQLPNHHFEDEIADYWLNRGISLTLSAKVLIAIELLKKRFVQARISTDSRPLHAKVYCGDYAATLGSSNFSHSGLVWQTEANARFTHQEKERFDETWQIAEHIWTSGKDYTDNLLKLLMQLLHTVTWQEALARACAEVLEGSWAKRYIQKRGLSDAVSLWPSQEQGIAQAMWVIEHIGSVLVADATGSGKTQMGAHLIRAVVQRIWASGRMRRHDLPVLICPSGMQDDWHEAGVNCGQLADIYSDGVLSNATADRHAITMSAIRRAQVLAVDEAHRYHNRTSGRTRLLFNNMADYVLLFTATPVNRGPYDLLALIDLLGADNFDEQVLEIFEQLRRREDKDGEGISVSERKILQGAIQQFTIRRTKSMLNEMIDASPHLYRDIHGNQCRYPIHKAQSYQCGESDKDRLLAQEIRNTAQQLRGLINLRSCFFLSDMQRKEGISEESYLKLRLKGAQNLVIHHIMKSVRSSRVALIEHIYGTNDACQRYGLQQTGKTKETGNILSTLAQCIGKPPENQLHISLPVWLDDIEEYTKVCQEEQNIYRKIAELVLQMSDAREKTKVNLLANLLTHHQLLIAFDSHLITLLDLQYRLQQMGRYNVILATGSNKQGRKQIKELGQPGVAVTKTIALCSDAMSEGFNLQNASAVVHLDMPSVIRIAEQRIGRIDRMNSPHTTIEAFWPDDSTEFALRSDERFFARHQFVAEVLGSNLPIPESTIVSSQEIIQEVERIDENNNAKASWDVISDAFEPVRLLIMGKSRLIRDRLIYEQMKTSTAHVVSSVSAIVADRPWAFFAVAGTEWGAPRWVYLDHPSAYPITNLEDVSIHLREVLSEHTINHTFDEHAATWLNRFLQRLGTTERLLLPIKKQRALSEMEIVLEHYQKKAIQTKELYRYNVISSLLRLLKSLEEDMSVDFSTLAECWLDLIRPIWYIHLLRRSRKNRPLLLKDIRQDLIYNPIDTEKLKNIFEVELLTRPLATRIVATIVGVPPDKNEIT